MSHLFWGGVDCVELARTYGTPLYVLDESMIRARCAEIRKDFLDRWPATFACYASKAFLTLGMAELVRQEGLGLDVVSGGELYLALKAGFPPERLELHGNAKSKSELKAALAHGVGRIMVDGQMELEVLAELAQAEGLRPSVLLRVSPGVNPNTHAHITTGHRGSKFGLPLEGDYLREAVQFAMKCPFLSLKGFHFHIGSQIFDNAAHVESVRRVVLLAEELKQLFGFKTEELNFGGGFGARISPEEEHVPLRSFTDAMMQTLTEECASKKLDRPAVTIEPGRWLVSEAGITLYTVETIKRLPEVVYVGVDGGMPDNPRPALYQAEYKAVLANKYDSLADERVAVAGKCCETGDVLVESVMLPSAERGDILAVFNTGAYNFSMASNYNRLPRPAMVWVNQGKSELGVARQNYDDLLLGDRIPGSLKR